MITNRYKALGRYEMLKAELNKTAVRFGSHIESARELLDALMVDDAFDMDVKKAKVLIDEAVILQRKANNLLEKMNEIKELYGINDNED